jgi:diguanylate cyclase (GGDEF)-like protein
MSDIDLITEAIAQLLKGRLPASIGLSPSCPQDEVRQLAEYVNRFLEQYRAFANAMFAVARGDVDSDVPNCRLHVCQSLKNLQANLRHLAWKTQQVADGDYSQHVDFMGSFSRNFNLLVDTLSKNREELHRQNQELQIAARTDALTGLANRRALDEDIQRRFSECQRSGAPLSVMLLDVDHFKDFNDAHGHRAGDEALRVIAGVLRATMRHIDVATRYGGEEFLVILPDTPIDWATAAAERARQEIRNTVFRFDGKEFSLTVSIGVAQFTFNERVARMLQRMDHALYAAKAAGRDRTYWHDGRGIHAVLDESEVIHPTQEPPQCPTAPLPSQAGQTVLAPRVLAPARWEATSLSGREPVRAMGYQYDRTAFFWHIRQRIAEWERGGTSFCVLLVHPQQDDIVETQSQEESAEVLRVTFRILNAVVRQMDAIGRCDDGRLGVLLPHTTLQEGLIAANRVHRAIDLSDPRVNSNSVQFALRIGVAEVAEGDDPIRLLQRAETAMSATESGCVCQPLSPTTTGGIGVVLPQEACAADSRVAPVV